FGVVGGLGDLKPRAVMEKIQKTLGRIPRGKTPPAVLAVEPPQNGERRVVVKKEAELPVVNMPRPVPNHRSNAAPALGGLSTILSGGRASRLYRDLVYQRQLALEAGGDYSYF